MPELPYPGSPSLSTEAREKVRQTFRHTIQLAKTGRNEEALLGCDFILKMDARFQPARRLLETLRGVASGTVVDLSPFAEYLGEGAAPAPTPNATPVSSPGSRPAAPAAPRPSAPPAPPAPADPMPAAAALDDLAFDDFGGGAAAGATQAVPPPPPSFDAGPDPDFGLIEPPVYEPPPSPSSPSSAPGQATQAFSSGGDPRIAQFLQQGDEAMNRGAVQEAIDLWSRVFLIDLSNEEASQRIDAAREQQAEIARRIDTLLAEGIHQFENGDLSGARSKFLEVLSISENDSTARNYLGQIETAMTERAPGAAVTLGGSDDFMKSELEAPSRPSFAPPDDLYEAAPEAQAPAAEEAPAKRPVKVDARLLVAAGVGILAVIGFVAYQFAKPKEASAPPPETRSGPAVPAPRAEDPIAQARTLKDQGKLDEARAILTGVPDSDPRYADALALLDELRRSAEPTPSAPAFSEAALDEMRLAGIAAAQASHYIDAVKNLDPVVKARPEDAEAADVLRRARERVAAMGSAVKAYNEQDYTTAIRLLWDLRKVDKKNQDVEEFLFKSYYNDAILDLQAGNSEKAVDAFKEAATLRPGDDEAQRHLKFSRKYSRGATDLLSRIYIKHIQPRA